MVTMTTNVEIAEFFSRFATAFSQGNIDAICSTFASGFGFSDPTTMMLITGTSQVHHLVQRSVERYLELGCDRVRIARLTPNLYNSEHAVIDLEWILLDQDSAEIVRFDSTYVLRKFSGVWKIVFVIAHNESERLQQVPVM